MRSLTHPGPVHPARIDHFCGEPVELDFTLQPGLTLHQALTAPMAAAGFRSGTVRFLGASVSPFRYVRPGPAPDDNHVAYFNGPFAPEGVSRIEQAAVTFGMNGGTPAMHCHAVWREPDGTRRGGHILPHDTVLAEATEARAIGFRHLLFDTALDEETNFLLFQPHEASARPGRGLLARVKPNQDILAAIETICRETGIRDAIVHGSLGSLIGAQFADGSRVYDHATEVLVRQGHVRDGQAALDLLVVDWQGAVHEGWLTRGENPVCITFDLVLTESG